MPSFAGSSSVTPKDIAGPMVSRPLFVTAALPEIFFYFVCLSRSFLMMGEERQNKQEMLLMRLSMARGTQAQQPVTLLGLEAGTSEKCAM